MQVNVLSKFPGFATAQVSSKLVSSPTPFHYFMTCDAYKRYTSSYDGLINKSTEFSWS